MTPRKPFVPDSNEISCAYHRLIGREAISYEDWVRFSEVARFDSRVAEAWLEKMSHEWKKLSPILLRDQNLESSIPATLGVLLEQVQDYCMPAHEKKTFGLWKTTVLHGVLPAHGESFLIGSYPFASRQMRQDAEFPTRSFNIWGFSGSEVFVNKSKSKSAIRNKTSLRREIRMRKLKAFLEKLKNEGKTRFSLESYLVYCDHLISRRVAQLDLKSYSKVTARGQTRARVYFIRPKKMSA